MKTSTLDKIIASLLFEAPTFGMPDGVGERQDRPVSSGVTDPDFKPTVPPELPLKPTAMMATQLADERPPVEDEEYVPTSVADLARAASAIAEMVPPGSIGFFYKQLHAVLDKAQEQQADAAAQEVEDAEGIPSPVKTEGRKLREAPEDDGEWQQRGRLMSPYDPDYDPLDPYYREQAADDDEEELPDTKDEKTILADLAKEAGYSGPSGVKQALSRLFKLMRYLVVSVGTDKLEDYMASTVPDYIETAKGLGVFSAQDARALMTRPADVTDLPSYRYYFNALYRPVYKKLAKQAEKAARARIKELGIPDGVAETVYNQAAGLVPRNDELILKRLAKLKPAERKRTMGVIRDNMKELQDIVEDVPDTLLADTVLYVDNMSDKKKQQAVLNAFKQAGEDVE